MLLAALLTIALHQNNRITPHTFRYVANAPGHTVHLAGDFNGWNKAATLMKPNAGGTLYTATVPITIGRHFYKFVIDDDNWITDPANPNSQDDGSGHTNSYIDILPPDYDQPAKLGDGKITLSALEHAQKLPYVNFDEGKLWIRLEARPDDIESVTLEANGREYPMAEVSRDTYFCQYEAGLSWDRKTDIIYDFKLRDGGTVLWFGKSGPTDSQPTHFVLHAATFKPFVVPSWVEHSVFYQIFPDRFANGDKANDGPDVQSWGGQPTYLNRFGGDLAGVSQHADYLKHLGVSCVYFNPIFEGPSNHGYETDDYHLVDHRFGTNQEFVQLTDKLKSLGIRTVLDGVFNHTSRGFFAFKDVVKNGKNSPYTDWYFFHGFPVRLTDPINYEGWYGFASLPKLNHANEKVQQYITGVPGFWQKQTQLGGWRLDAAEQVSDDFWRLFRTAVKSIDPNLWICGEIWTDASHWLQGDMFDSVMNYQFRDALLGFLSPTGDGKPSTAWNHLMTTYNSYAPQVDRNMMNLVDSHDTERLLTEVGHSRKLADLAAILEFTWVGAPCVYYGDEVGLDGGKDPDNRRCMPWDQATEENPTLRLYESLISIRNHSQALQVGRPLKGYSSDADQILSFYRVSSKQTAWVILNRSGQPREIEGDGHVWKDAVSGAMVGQSAKIEVEPQSARILLRDS